MKTTYEWQDQATGIIRTELERRNLGGKNLASSLQVMQIKETEWNILNKIARESFTELFPSNT
jgi:hypothetical protein